MHFLPILLVLLMVSPVGGTDCDGLYTRTETVRDVIRAEIRRSGQVRSVTLRRFAEAARAARHCYADREPERVVRLFQRELYALNDLGRHAEALDVADAFFGRFGASSSVAARIYVLQQEADALRGLGRPGEAIRSLTRALAHAEALSVPAQVELLLEVADLYQHLTDFAAARVHLARAERLLVSSGFSSDVMLAKISSNQAELAVTEADRTGKRHTPSLLNAAERARQAAVLFTNEHRMLAAPLAHVKALEALAYAGRPEEALTHLEKAQRLAAQTGHRVVEMTVAYKGGRLHLQRRAFDEAEPLLMRALELAEQENHVDYMRRITYDVGLLHELSGELNGAADWYRRSMDLTEEYHGSLRTSEWAANTFANWQPPYRGLVRVSLQQGQTREAFIELERTRARHLFDLRRTHVITSETPDADRVQLDSLARELEEVRDEIRPMKPSDPRRLSLEVRESMTQLRINRLLNLENVVPSFSIDSLQQTLRRDDRTLISYLIDRPNPVMPRPPSSLAFVLTADTLLAVPLKTGAASLHRMIEQVSPALLQERQALALNDLQYNLDVLHALYDTLFTPLAPHVRPGQRLTIIPDRFLFALPFGMLVEQTEGPFSYESATYLIERHPIALDVSVALAGQRRPRLDDDIDVAAFGRADFGALRDSLPSSILRSSAGLTLRSNGAFDLPLVRDELNVVRDLFGSVRVALDEAATESNFYEVAERASVLHVATHATTDPRSPLYNAFFLSTSADDEEDGLVHLYELQRRDLGSALVVLSGCNTGRGTLYLGEGMQGLQYGFMAAGAQSVLAHTWFVEDEASLRLVRSFYRHLRDGLPKDVALQRAQIDYLREAPPGMQSPFFWASPVLYGQSVALQLEPGSSFPVWWVVLLAAVALAAAVWYRRRASLR